MRALRILYVEDQADLRDAIGDLLAAGGHTVMCCGTAEEALVHVDDTGIDVLVTDLSLPGLSGTELARRWLARDAQRWVVLCTGYATAEALKRLGVHVRVLVKPFDLPDLDALLGEIMAAIDRPS